MAAKDWLLTSLKESLIKNGREAVSHVAFQMADVAIPRNLFADMMRLTCLLTENLDATVS